MYSPQLLILLFLILLVKMTELAAKIGQSIRQIRKQSNITQESLALQCGIDRRRIQT